MKEKKQNKNLLDEDKLPAKKRTSPRGKKNPMGTAFDMPVKEKVKPQEKKKPKADKPAPAPLQKTKKTVKAEKEEKAI